jgi:hypothetical protein
MISTPNKTNKIRVEPIQVCEHQAVRRPLIYHQPAARYQLRGLSAGLFQRR